MSGFFTFAFGPIFTFIFVFTLVMIIRNAMHIGRVQRRVFREAFRHQDELVSPKQAPRDCRYCRTVITDSKATHCPHCGAQLPFER